MLFAQVAKISPPSVFGTTAGASASDATGGHVLAEDAPENAFVHLNVTNLTYDGPPTLWEGSVHGSNSGLVRSAVMR